jgi:hypothetical protein
MTHEIEVRIIGKGAHGGTGGEHIDDLGASVLVEGLTLRKGERWISS